MSRKYSKRRSHKKRSRTNKNIGNSPSAMMTGKQALSTLIDNKIGGCSCGDEGAAGMLKTGTFKDYMSEVAEKVYGNKKEQQGGGCGAAYSINPESYIAGQPLVSGYDSCDPPVVLSNRLSSGGGGCNPNGGGYQTGGTATTKKRKTRKNKRKQRGGACDFTSGMSSKPAPYSAAFTGAASDFRDPAKFGEMNFGARQPIWGPSDL